MKQPHKCPLCEMSPAKWEKLRDWRDVRITVEEQVKGYRSIIWRCLKCGFVVTVHEEEEEKEPKNEGDLELP